MPETALIDIYTYDPQSMVSLTHNELNNHGQENHMSVAFVYVINYARYSRWLIKLLLNAITCLRNEYDMLHKIIFTRKVNPLCHYEYVNTHLHNATERYWNYNARAWDFFDIQIMSPTYNMSMVYNMYIFV